jgi:hypothetical protein
MGTGPIRSLFGEDRAAKRVRDWTRPSTPPSAPGLVHVWSTRHRNGAVRNGLLRYIVAQVADAILRKRARMQNPDKDKVAWFSRRAKSHYVRGAGLTRRPPRQTPTTWSGLARTLMSASGSASRAMRSAS